MIGEGLKALSSYNYDKVDKVDKFFAKNNWSLTAQQIFVQLMINIFIEPSLALFIKVCDSKNESSYCGILTKALCNIVSSCIMGEICLYFVFGGDSCHLETAIQIIPILVTEITYFCVS